ncbi:MAG: SiaB family protein kinase [Firmicutes bacterium]|nr:SiaB family protein kinase [Bacillota bacterium]
MINPDLFELQSLLRTNGLLISFSGRFSQEIIEELGEAVKKYLETEKHPKNNIFNIFSIFIEQTQNIKNYCASKAGTDSYETIANSCIVTIGKSGDGNYICSGNLIENEDLAKPVQSIEKLTGLDKDALKKLYKEKLKQDLLPGSTGAGVGLVEMARKASHPLEYSVTSLDERFSYFTLKAVV